MSDDNPREPGDASAHNDEPILAKADHGVLHAAVTGEGLVRITSSRQLHALANAAQQTFGRFQDLFVAMSGEQAEFVRKLRCEDGYSWRAVAETCALEWGGDWGSNQLAGMAICERAAQLHGEHFMEEPWN